MAIYLDTNIICRWRNFDTADRLALSIAATQLEQRIVVPEVVAIEALAHRERELVSILKRFEEVEVEVKENFEIDDLFTEVTPDIERRLEHWRQLLYEFCDVLPTNPEDAVQALTREARGRAPAKKRAPNKPGAGARDAAIWLAILRDHHDRGEPGFFISANTSDFIEGDGLKRELVEDLSGRPQRLEVKKGVGELLEAIGTSEQRVSVDAETVTSKALDAVRNGLADSEFVPRAVFLDAADFQFRTVVTRAKASRVIDAKQFARDQEGVLVIDAEWDLKADCFFRKSDAESWWGSVPVRLNGRIQVYVPEQHSTNGGGELIAARLRSDTYVFFSHGEPVIVGDPGVGDRLSSAGF